jgi:hypothetical protein
MNAKCQRAVTQTHRLPFDGLRANGGMLKSCDFSVHAELVEAKNRFGQQPVKTLISRIYLPFVIDLEFDL